MSAPGRPIRVALVHDWLTGMRGGEKVLACLCRMFPDADIFTLIHRPGACPPIDGRSIRTSWLDDLPGVARYYRRLLPLMPLAVERMDVSDYDLVISSSHCVAKGIGGIRAGQVHVCYCHTPMRYVWAVEEDYRRQAGVSGMLLRAFTPYLRAWDRRSAGRADLFLANSACVARRIRQAYGRTAVVLYPPVDVDYFTPADVQREDFYLVVAAMAPYKRIDQAVAAFASLKRPLKIIGSGPLLGRLRAAAPPNVEFLGWQADEVLRDHYRRCRAVIFPQLEDFGLVPLEAMACGTPVIAFGAGGALETVLDAADPAVPAPTGLLYDPQTPEALAATVQQFEALTGRFDPKALRRWAVKFSPKEFMDGFRRAVHPLVVTP
ncbi:MAG: glycosyltransferase [Phycisphaerae bacterium]